MCSQACLLNTVVMLRPILMYFYRFCLLRQAQWIAGLNKVLSSPTAHRWDFCYMWFFLYKPLWFISTVCTEILLARSLKPKMYAEMASISFKPFLKIREHLIKGWQFSFLPLLVLVIHFAWEVGCVFLIPSNSAAGRLALWAHSRHHGNQ